VLTTLAVGTGAPAAAAPSEIWRSAPRSLADCDEAIRAHPDAHEAYACFLRLAHSWSQGRAPVQRHLEERLRRHPGDLLAQLWLGILAHDASQVSVAVHLLAPVADAFHARALHQGEVLARAELVILLCYNDRAQEAEPQLFRLSAAAQRSGSPELEANALLSAAVCARKARDHGRAIALYGQARSRLSQAPASFRTELLTHQILDGLGSAYSDSGRHREAYAVFGQQSVLATGDPFLLAIVKHRLASQAVNLADDGELEWEEADRRIQESLDMERQLSAPAWPPYVTRILHAARLGPSTAALTDLDQALAFWRPRAAWGVLTALRLRARFLSDLDPAHPATALGQAEESLAMARRTGNHWNTAMGLLTRAYVRWKGGARSEAIADSLATLDELDRLRDFQADQLVRAWTSSETSFAYPLVAGWLLDPSRGAPSTEDVEHAFQAMERHRARVLLEALVSARITPELPAGELRDRQARILSQLTQIQRQLLDRSLEGDARSRVLDELSRLEREEEVVRDELARGSARSAALELSPPTAAEVQRALGAEEAVLSFQTWKQQHDQDATYRDGSSWVMTITRDAIRTFRIPDSNELRGRVQFLHATIDARDGSEAPGASWLYQELLSRALQGLPRQVRHLILVPDGPLHRLPFELLQERPGAEPLGARYELSVVPSVALWLRWRELRAHGPTLPGSAPSPLALVLANPSLPGQSPDGEEPEEPEAIVSLRGSQLPPLQASEREARAITSALEGRTQVLLGPDAAEHWIKTTNLSRFGILHFATHSVVDERVPGRSAVMLAPGAPGDDGLLQMREVVALELTGKLVVLAACRSASGALLGGEGPVSLARAFFQAGAPAVIGSSRPLGDEETAELMGSFYSGLGRGLSVSAAMLQARRDRIRARAPTAAWAGMTVLGDGGLVPLPGARGPPVVSAPAVAALAATLLLVAVAYRRRAPPARSRPRRG
jgi:CHAT domain-containing protein